jgi:prepilin-type N-terminal cleavage/methylation domain-containing protein
MVFASLQPPTSMVTKIRRIAQSGFTLVEMLAVIGIIMLVSGVVLANNNKWGGQVSLQNLAYDIALSIREAQVFGISVQRFQNEDLFLKGYGMYFSTASPDVYVLFGERVNENGILDTGETVQSTTLQSGYTIAHLFVTKDGVETATGTVRALNITFRRPEPDAYILKATDSTTDSLIFDDDGGFSPAAAINEQARIVVRSPRGDLRSIIVSVNGQISVQ